MCWKWAWPRMKMKAKINLHVLLSILFNSQLILMIDCFYEAGKLMNSKYNCICGFGDHSITYQTSPRFPHIYRRRSCHFFYIYSFHYRYVSVSVIRMKQIQFIDHCKLHGRWIINLFSSLEPRYPHMFLTIICTLPTSHVHALDEMNIHVHGRWIFMFLTIIFNFLNFI